MESDEFVSPNSRKRPRSPSPVPTPKNAMVDTPPVIQQESKHQRQPKRQRKAKDVPAYDAPPDDHVLRRMERSNPLNRRVLKKEAKRARKALRAKTDPGSGVGGMEVDDEGLQFTFMA